MRLFKGKTSIVKRFLTDKYDETYKPTVEELYQNQYKLENSVTVTLDILDTSGSYQFPGKLSNAMRQLIVKIITNVNKNHKF